MPTKRRVYNSPVRGGVTNIHAKAQSVSPHHGTNMPQLSQMGITIPKTLHIFLSKNGGIGRDVAFEIVGDVVRVDQLYNNDDDGRQKFY